MGHGAFHGVYQEQRAVYHVYYALHLAAKVGMAGGIDDVDGGAVVHNAGIFSQNGNAAFLLQIVGVENTLLHFLVGAENVGLAQHAIDQRGFAVIHVGNNGDVANIVTRL